VATTFGSTESVFKPLRTRLAGCPAFTHPLAACREKGKKGRALVNNSYTIITVISCVVAFGAIVCCRADNDERQAKVAASSDSGRQSDPYTGCVRIFDGKSFKGWEADAYPKDDKLRTVR
jgi:hypothetical protein